MGCGCRNGGEGRVVAVVADAEKAVEDRRVGSENCNNAGWAGSAMERGAAGRVIGNKGLWRLGIVIGAAVGMMV